MGLSLEAMAISTLPTAAMGQQKSCVTTGRPARLLARSFLPETGQGFTDIAFGPNGNLFVSGDFTAQNVKQYSGQTGAFIGVFASANLFRPQNLTFGPDGNTLRG